MQVYKDGRLLRPCLNALRYCYPDARVIIRSDGDDDPEYPKLAEDYGAEYIQGKERLYLLQHGGKVGHVALEAFAKKATDYLVKIDPDTLIVRPLKIMPKADIFGSPQHCGGIKSIQGGFFGFKQLAAFKLYTSGLLLSQELKDGKTWGVKGDAAERWKSGLTSFDWTVGWALTKLKLSTERHPEVKSSWKYSVENFDGDPAVVHPWFNKEVL